MSAAFKPRITFDDQQDDVMSDPMDALTQQLRAEGTRQFAAWNAETFDSYINGPIKSLRRQLDWYDKSDVDHDSVKNLTRMIYEGVGTGWLLPHSDDHPPATFLSHILWSLVPHQLGKVPRKKRSEVLTRIWNLAEGLAREPQWLNQFVISRIDWSTDIAKLDSMLATILAPVLTPLPAAQWNRLRGLKVLNLRESHAEFLPGRISLAAPAILSIEDRCRPGVFLAVWLRKAKVSEVVGLVRRLPDYVESFAAPLVVATEDAVTINEQRIETPLLMTPHQVLAVSSGFVVLSSEDSQRLWLVESE